LFLGEARIIRLPPFSKGRAGDGFFIFLQERLLFLGEARIIRLPPFSKGRAGEGFFVFLQEVY
jgi:hypothetical protein